MFLSYNILLIQILKQLLVLNKCFYNVFKFRKIIYFVKFLIRESDGKCSEIPACAVVMLHFHGITSTCSITTVDGS